MFATEPSPPQQAPGIIDATLRYRELSVALAVAGVILGALYGLFSSGGTTATGHLSLTDPRGSATFRDGSSVVDFARYVNDRVDFATSSEVLLLASKAFPKAGTPGDIRGKCEVTGEDGGSVMTISCTDDDSATAMGTVDAVVAAYRQATEEQAATKAKAALDALTPEKETLQKKLDALKNAEGSDVYNNALSQATASRLNELEKRGTDIRTTQALFGDGTESYDSARVSASASYLTNAVKYGLVGGIVGLIFAVLTAWFRADRDPIADDAQDVSGWLDLPLLGEIEHRFLETDTINLTAPPDTTFQRVASNLDAVLSGETVLFTPAVPISRHEDVVVNTALTAARAGKRVLLVDGDQAGRSISNLLGLPPGTGLAEFVAGEAPADEATVRLGFSKVPGMASSSLYLMGPGGEPGGTPSLLRPAEAAAALRELQSSYDLILIDGPPLLASATSSVLGQVVDGIVVLVERGTPRPRIDDTRRQLDFLASDAVGCVFIHDA